MIGKEIRGYRHFSRLADNSPKEIIFFHGFNRVVRGTMLKAKEGIVVYQGLTGGSVSNHYTFDCNTSTVNKARGNYNYSFCIKHVHDYRGLIQGKILLLPNDFNESYNKFLGENKKLCSSVIGKYCTNTDSIGMYMYCLCPTSPNLFVWGLTNFFKHRIDIHLIEHITRFNTDYNQMVNKLSKGTITAYNNPSKVLELDNEILNLKRLKRSNDVINKFNTAQKRLLKTLELTDKTVETFSKFSTLSDVKQLNFIKKMSSIEDVDDIMHQMRLLCNVHFEWNKDSVLDFIKNGSNINCDIIIDRDNILLVKVNNYDTIKHLAKSTNWCISKNKHYWNNYVEHKRNANQYVVFDFSAKEDSELSIIGFTMDNVMGITNAHSFTNNNLMGNMLDDSVNLNSFIVRLSKNEIYDILKNFNIDVNDLLPTVKNKYEWNHDSFIKYIDEFFEENYDILLDEGNKFVFSVEHCNKMYDFLGECYNKVTCEYGDINQKHIFFCDFDKNERDKSRMCFIFTIYEGREKEERNSRVYDINCKKTKISFETLLTKFNLPYDLICRTFNPLTVLSNTLATLNAEELDKNLNNEEIKCLLKSNSIKQINSRFYEALQNSLLRYKSFEIFNVIYKHGYTVGELCGKYGGELFCNIGYDMLTYSDRHKTEIPNQEDFEKLANGTIENDTEAICVGYFKILQEMVKNEKADFVFNKLCTRINDFYQDKRFGKYFVNLCLDKTDFTQHNEVTYKICLSLMYYQDIDFVKKLIPKFNKTTLNYLKDNIGKSHPCYKTICEFVETKEECIAL